MDFRCLLLTSCFYRVWARLRLKQLDHWVKLRQCPQHYAGVRGKSAQDAWYGSALAVETCVSQQRNVMITCLDLFKAFDQ
eukprot:13459311-Alexandrium_andersonii.AAC.1